MISCKLCKSWKGSRQSVNDNLSFHTCPKNPEVAKLWIEFVDSELGTSTSVGNVILCSRHFEKHCSSIKMVLRPNYVRTMCFSYSQRIHQDVAVNSRPETNCSSFSSKVESENEISSEKGLALEVTNVTEK